MKKLLLLALVSAIYFSANAQVPGDTIVVNAFNYSQTYGSGIRDTMLSFPNNPNLTFEKIIMLYNMRCKGGVVGNNVPPNGTAGCGEWDYSCNTYITDSTKTDSTKATHPSHIIPGISGNVYNYTLNPTYTYDQYTQQQVIYNSTITETVSTVGAGLSTSSSPFLGANKVAKSQFLWTAAELIAAGVSVGDITSIRLNVSNAGSAAQFLKVRMKATTKDSLLANDPDLTGYTEVYFLNTNLTNGINQLNFYNNFSWNGTDNIIVEFSFTNGLAGTNSLVTSDNTPKIMGLVSTDNDYAIEFSGASLIDLANANFVSFNNEMSVGFWSYGHPDFIPRNTTIFHAANTQGQRELNVHLPWSNSRIYWDCGSGGATDRIDKAAAVSDLEGKWNYYVFTKNTTTGVMNIYLNGVVWHTGTGKTLPIQISDFVIGATNALQYPYFGKVDDFTIWNKELSAATIQEWMYKDITASHPNYTNLMAHYKLNEGNGTSLNDISVNTATSTINGLANWYLFKGKDLFKNFTETYNRPSVSFVQGTYTQTVTPIIVMDSVENYRNTVYSFVVNGNAVSPFDTNYYYQAGYSYIYDGDSGTLLDSVLNATQSTININPLTYYQTSPSRFQIMSFVTPYGNGLDLGPNGKTWTFDLTDFAPIMKGSKRMTMDAGGQWQEDMDIKFLFIVGTPPKDILDINNIWKVEATSNSNIINDNKYEPRNLTLNANGSSFKIRSAITGHGQQGEFISRAHSMNIDGGSPEFTWDVWKLCAENPVYPQGGTWVYDRAGWCPGMATDLVEFDITPYVMAGQSANFDYHMVPATGHSDYWVSQQLVEYGAANFILDAAIVEIKNPATKVEYARTNPFCNDPQITIRNTGSTTLTSLKIEYWVNNNPNKLVFNWSGSLDFMEEADVSLPKYTVYDAVNSATGNKFNVEISDPNGGVDEYAHNNKFQSNFDVTGVVPSTFAIMVKTNNNGAETSYKVLDENNNPVLTRSNLADNTIYLDTLQLPFGCYTFEILDAGENGLSWWAAPSQGSGYARLRNVPGGYFKLFEPDFGKSLRYSFTVDYALSTVLVESEKEIKLYPNPAQDEFILESKNINKHLVKIYNYLGQQIKLPSTQKAGKVHYDSSDLAPGIYQIVIIVEGGGKHTKKLLIR